MSELKKLRNLVAPPLSGVRKDNASKYAKCVAEYSDGTYSNDLVWKPSCERMCETCPYTMSHEDYIQAMTDVAVRQ